MNRRGFLRLLGFAPAVAVVPAVVAAATKSAAAVPSLPAIAVPNPLRTGEVGVFEGISFHTIGQHCHCYDVSDVPGHTHKLCFDHSHVHDLMGRRVIVQDELNQRAAAMMQHLHHTHVPPAGHWYEARA